jgi:hypothetical protein
MSRSRYYILDGHTPVPCDMDTWARKHGDELNRVKLTEQGDVMISTVFLGMDHRFFGNGPPLIFETMLFIADEGHDCVRYSNWDDAVAGHDAMVRRVFTGVRAASS